MGRMSIIVAPVLSLLVASVDCNGEVLESLVSATSRVESSFASLELDVKNLKSKLHAMQEEEAKGDNQSTHGRTLFMTMCSGSEYFNMYCGPFLASFERAYGSAASTHRVAAFTTHVDANVLEAASQRFKPWFTVEPLEQELFGKQYDILHQQKIEKDKPKCDRTGGECRLASGELGMAMNDLRTGIDVLIKFRQAASYLGRHGAYFQYAVVMDSDALFVRPLTQFLPARRSPPDSSDWNVAFTAYDKEFSTPWAADPSESGMTKNGHVRINAGILLLNLEDLMLSRRFLNRWAHVSELLFTGGRPRPAEECVMWQQWQQMLVDDFSGIDPAGLLLLLSSYETDSLQKLVGWDTCSVCGEVVEAKIGMYGGEGAMPVRFRAFPARVLNHAESMPNGTFSKDLMIVRLKGPWWRTILADGTLIEDATRTPEWNQDTLRLHNLARSEWQLGLPPESREPIRSRTFFL